MCHAFIRPINGTAMKDQKQYYFIAVGFSLGSQARISISAKMPTLFIQ